MKSGDEKNKQESEEIETKMEKELIPQEIENDVITQEREKKKEETLKKIKNQNKKALIILLSITLLAVVGGLIGHFVFDSFLYPFVLIFFGGFITYELWYYNIRYKRLK